MTTATKTDVTVDPGRRVTLRDWRRWARERQPFGMLTCYDATTARWLWRGGVHSFLVGDTAAQMVFGHDSTLPATMEQLLALTAAVRRGAPNALVMADMPFGSYHESEAQAMRNAVAFLKEAGADLVKLEVDDSHASLVEKMAHSGVPVVAHIGSRPQQVRATGGFRSAGREQSAADAIVQTAALMIAKGASALLVEAVPDEVSQRIMAVAVDPVTGDRVPVIGCGAGPGCDGHVVVLHDLLGLSDWQPPFAPPVMNLGEQIQLAAKKWADQCANGEYLADGGVYGMKE